MDRPVIEIRIKRKLDAAEHDLLVRFRQISAEVAAKGQLQSGRHLVMKGEAVADAIDALITSGLADVESVEQRNGDVAAYYDALKTAAIQLKLLGEGEIRAKGGAWIQPSQLRALTERMQPRLEQLLSRLDDHKNGFDRRTGGVVPSQLFSVSNSPGAVLQAHSPGATAATNVAINIEQVRDAVSVVEAAVNMLAEDAPERRDFAAEIDTLRSQLRKETPNRVILRESAATVRSLAENVVASAMTPGLLAAAHALWLLLT